MPVSLSFRHPDGSVACFDDRVVQGVAAQRVPKVARTVTLTDWQRIIIAVLLLPNLVVCARFIGFAAFFRGYVNVEILLLAAAYAVTRSRIILLCASAEFLLDLVEPVENIYYFNTRDAFDSLRYINMLPFWHLVAGAAAIIGYVGLLTADLRYLMPALPRRSAFRVAAVLSVVAVLLFGFDCFSGRYRILRPDLRKFGVNAVRTPALSVCNRVWLLWTRTSDVRPRGIRSASIGLLTRSGVSVFDSRANVVLVIVEAWGKLNDGKTAARSEQLYNTAEMRARYEIDTGVVPFVGLTVYGEARELCGHVFARGMPEGTADDLKGCLPNVFARQGYSTIGLHGFHARMYDRIHWYPKVGFSTALFEDDFDRLGMRTCSGGLDGTCDVDVARWIANRLGQSSAYHPVFLHWVSLNSHVPVPDDISATEHQYCQSISPVLADRALCKWYLLIDRVHQSVSRIALAKSLRPTAFVIVGDHAPPFSSSKRREAFSQTEVPYVLLTPKSINARQ